MVFLVLYSRYRSAVLAGIVMANIPLALDWQRGGDVGRGVSLSVANGGFITLAGIATRNGIPEDQPLHQPVSLRGRAVRHPDDRARFSGATDAGADDGTGTLSC